ncbi:MAG: hypothetical protein Q7U44_00540 [Desulfuromonadales bacterium]|nr:hypothetical protein [Desulfuromonadales bacterium]
MGFWEVFPQTLQQRNEMNGIANSAGTDNKNRPRITMRPPQRRWQEGHHHTANDTVNEFQ